MHSFDITRIRRSTLIAVVLLLLFAFHLHDDYTHLTPLYWQTSQLKGARLWDTLPIEPGWIWNSTTDSDNLMLTHLHCEQAFHGLFSKIDQSVRRHKAPHNRIPKSDLDRIDGMAGVVRAMIYQQKLYVISSGGLVSSRSFMVLSQIHRAVVTSPEEVPSIEFAFVVDDRHTSPPLPQGSQWNLMRPQNDYKTWLMPDFGFFSSAETGVKSFHEVRTQAEDVDSALSWQHKQPKLLWRGGTRAISTHSDFLDATSDAKWADIQAIGSTGSAASMLDMDEHCGSKYLAHTDGRAYTGRLKYLLLCRSVVITEPMKWVTYHSHLMQKDGPDQNYLEVKPDWSDLESKVRHLQSWDTLGERIAKNSVETFRERYLTPAAEVCSWRRLFKGWAEVVAFEPELYEVDEDGKKQERGVLFERFIVDMMFQ